MSQVSFIDLAGLLDDAGFNGGTPTQTGISIVCAESGRNPDAKHVNTDGSIDRGLWQINDKWHPEVTDAMAYDPVLATGEAARISSQGSNYAPWSTFGNGAYRAHMEAAAVAMAGRVLKVKLAAAQVSLNACRASLLAAQDELAQAKIDAQATIDSLEAKIAAAQKALS